MSNREERKFSNEDEGWKRRRARSGADIFASVSTSRLHDSSTLPNQDLPWLNTMRTTRAPIEELSCDMPMPPKRPRQMSFGLRGRPVWSAEHPSWLRELIELGVQTLTLR